MPKRVPIPPAQRQVDPLRKCKRAGHVGFYRQNTYGLWKCGQCARDTNHASDVRNGRINAETAGTQRGKPRTRKCDADEIECSSCRTVRPRSDFSPSRLAKNAATCRPCGVVAANAWKVENAERYLATLAVWRDANRDEQRAYDIARYWADPEAARSRTAAYLRANPGKRALWQQNRNARALGIEGNDLTDEQWQAIVEAYGGACLACGRTDQPLTRDHIVPLSKGGALTLDNVQPLCRGCNSSKGAREIDYRAA